MVSANDLLIDGSTENTLSRSDGVILLGFFLIFFGYTFAIARSHAEGDETEAIKEMPIGKSALFIVAGLAGLIYGGQFFVDGSSQIARSLGVSESVIGLTLVAGGTSLPELATSVVAAWKKNPQMAIGNVVGSNLFNIFLVLGVSSSIYPLRVQGITFLDYAVMLGSCIMLFIFGRFFKKQMITRWEGIVMVLCFLVYMTYLVMNALATEGPTREGSRSPFRQANVRERERRARFPIGPLHIIREAAEMVHITSGMIRNTFMILYITSEAKRNTPGDETKP